MKTDWNSILNKINVGEDFIYITKQSEEVKEKLLKLLNNEISLEVIVPAMVNTLRLIETNQNIDGFKFTEIPSIENFAGCFCESADNMDGVMILSFSQLLQYYRSDNRKRYYCKYLNPILYDLIKNIVGDELDNINDYLNKTIFIKTLTNIRKDTVRRAIGLDYRVESLSMDEMCLKEDFISREKLMVLAESLRCMIPCTCYKFDNCKSYGCTLSLINFIKQVNVNEKMIESLMYEESECNVDTAISCFLLKYIIGVTEDIPINYETIMKKYNLDINGLNICTYSSTLKPPIKRVKSKDNLKRVVGGRFDRYLILWKNDEYIVYKLRLREKDKLEYTGFAKAVMRKYNISEVDILDKLYLFEAVVSKNLLGEACLIETIVSQRKIYLPVLQKYYRGNSYYQSMRRYNLPISILRDR